MWFLLLLFFDLEKGTGIYEGHDLFADVWRKGAHTHESTGGGLRVC